MLSAPFANVFSRYSGLNIGITAWLAEFADLGKQGEFFFSLNRYLFTLTERETSLTKLP
jgi:hypothetical protein